jgi:Uma2 family endonuclease
MAIITLDEYLKTSYPGLDLEFVDGAVVTRPLPPFSHGELQARLAVVFDRLSQSGRRFFTAVEVRSRTSGNRIRLPDFSAWLERPAEAVPTTPPYVAAEILSPDDRVQPLMEKLREYRAWGVAHIWLIDPQYKTMAEFGSSGLLDVAAYRLPEYNLEVTCADLFPEPR